MAAVCDSSPRDQREVFTACKWIWLTRRVFNAAWDGDKVDLAEKSGLWRVYQDKGSCQTRTLDKYLHVETVHKTPRWRNVVRTLDFVLKHTSEQSPHYQSLKQAQSDIQNWVSQDKGRR
ncbi:hypothetical protein [Salinivibrio sp. IB282]|uniref:hypothetical protein n=1 Tax=Salinivibrio sp. IB282 TaxID=1766122 RepID=UPI000D52DDE0